MLSMLASIYKITNTSMYAKMEAAIERATVRPCVQALLTAKALHKLQKKGKLVLKLAKLAKRTRYGHRMTSPSSYNAKV